MTNGIFVSLDIGTSQIRTMVAELSARGTYQVIGVGTAKSAGIKRGVIINLDQVVQAINLEIAGAEQMVIMVIDNVYVSFLGNYASLQTSHGVVAVAAENKEIKDTDIERVIQAAWVIAVPPDREIIEVIPKYFVLDGVEGIKDPRGMAGIRLEVVANIITGSKTMVYNITRCVNKAGLNVAGLIFLPAAMGTFCLSADERNLGAVLLDIGAGTTTLSYFKAGNLEFTTVIPIGGDYITNDISVGFRAELDHAEEIKCKHGIAAAEFAATGEQVALKSIGEGGEQFFSQLELAYVIEPRVKEIFQLVYDELTGAGISTDPAGGYVLTGGVVSLPYIVDVARKILGNSVRIFIPRNLASNDPAFTGGLAMMQYSIENNYQYGAYSGMSGKRVLLKKAKKVSLLARIKNWFREII